MKLRTFRTWLEVRSGAMEYLQSLIPSWPPYVVQDMVYGAFKDKMDKAQDYLSKFAQWTGHQSPNDIQWSLKTIPIKLEMFDPNTKEMLQNRIGGGEMIGARDDFQRHAAQKSIVANNPSKEPIIVATTPAGYTLFEGSHRTIQSLKNWPDGYQQKAWVFNSKNDLSPHAWPKAT